MSLVIIMEQLMCDAGRWLTLVELQSVFACPSQHVSQNSQGICLRTLARPVRGKSPDFRKSRKYFRAPASVGMLSSKFQWHGRLALLKFHSSEKLQFILTRSQYANPGPTMSFAKTFGQRATTHIPKSTHLNLRRTYASSSYEHILTSTPKPGVGMSTSSPSVPPIIPH